MDELLADFVAETREMLEASAGEIVAWEADPTDRTRLDTIFRFVHTVKGNCGFFDLPRLASLSHAAEDALADCRSERRIPDAALVNAVLAIIDRIVAIVDAIEAGEDYPEGGDEELIAALEEGAHGMEVRPNAGETNGSAPDPSPKCTDPVTAQRSIRLPVDLLDRVMSGVSDMVLARNDLAHRLRQAGAQPTIDGPFERLTTILSDVRDAVTRMRMQRIETLFASFPRLVRDLSNELGKQVMLEVEGGDVELDREMIEMIRDPLTHIIRNAIDHGFEPPAERLEVGKHESGRLSIAARQSGNTIAIVVSDDGRGLDEDRIAAKAEKMGLITAAQADQMGRDALLQMIFQPGFSTAQQVSTVSGRGVGLDVVQDNLERIGGLIEVSSTRGEGTLFTLQIPLTLSIIAGLKVETRDQRFAIPQSYVEEIVHTSSKALDFTRAGETALVTFRSERVPCLMLGDVLGLNTGDADEADQTMVMLRLASGDLFALGVDRIHSHGDIVVKPLAPAIMKNRLYAGSTLLDDGQPVLLLDVASIAGRYGLVSDTRTRMLRASRDDEEMTRAHASRAMLFTDFDGRRCAVRLEVVRRIETIPAAAIDLTGPHPRAVIEGVILPLIGLPDGQLAAEKVRLLRLCDGLTELLHAVREVDDAALLDDALKPVPDDPLVEAVTLVDGRTVTLLDAHSLFARHGEVPERQDRPVCRLPETEWASTILAPLVEAAGYDITHGIEGEADIAIWLDDEYEAARALDLQFDTPVIRLRDVPDAPGEADTVYRYDREGLIEALGKARKHLGRAS